jgi:hypothetical protein
MGGGSTGFGGTPSTTERTHLRKALEQVTLAEAPVWECQWLTEHRHRRQSAKGQRTAYHASASFVYLRDDREKVCRDTDWSCCVR